MILLLHAFPLNSQMYSLLQQELYDAGEEICAPDYPGFGGQEETIESLDGYAQQLLKTLPEEGIVGLGLSMGGYLLMRLLDLAPERFRGAIFANTRMGQDTPEARQNRLNMAEKVLKEGVEFLPQAMLQGLIGKDAPEDIQDSVKTMILQASPEGVAAAQKAMADRPDSREVLSKLQIPVLVIAGSEDTLIPLEAMKDLAEVTKGKLVKLKTAHLSNLLDPEGFNGAVLDFLEELETTGE
ncbi:alpha/beta fold hydrolase [Deinococcus cellulosilyticus]|uniref:Hydrolase n=1 Tax=Deinococcus cellulosilyticus (strain DSM 18568 / NBRC 106333 / KACC 11606 / 5516J-15) TaxID=1223518 RepID=A0A511N2F7_DEIC1|nr:alpha/beta hydrolase [Deinococcus cellulosilyticus]GEM47040.1 hydrolase [Deinococcus cellulosilyticus NBRC 106333 = KACC 11606]